MHATTLGRSTVSHKRSSTGRHNLLPASNERGENVFIPLVPIRSIASWTLGRGTVIRTIWPAVLLHTVFGAGVTSVSIMTRFNLGVPPVLITVLGVVLGFVIAYRASSGYDRYWMGRCCWSDLVRTCRTMGRLIWFHVPLRTEKGRETTEDVTLRVMREKRLALELIEGFVIALKHHLRGEIGIYYEDLYPLVRPLHNHQFNLDGPHLHKQKSHPSDDLRRQNDISVTASPSSPQHDPVIPLINSYGTFPLTNELPVPIRRRGRIERRGSHSGSSSCSDRSASGGHVQHPILFPSSYQSSSSPVSTDLIPFSSVLTSIAQVFGGRKGCDEEDVQGNSPVRTRHTERAKGAGRKKIPKVAGAGENLPLEILRCLSECVSVLDERDVMSGSPLGGLYSCLSAYEDSLSALERILTTPLPFIYSVHIRQCVWTYLFLLPFQLVSQFGWFTIPGVAVAALFYIGFLAAGEEIEQPFGYDENDLDLDLFCQEIVHADIDALLRTPCPNAYLPGRHEHHSSAHRSSSGIERAATILQDDENVQTKGKGTSDLQGVFGTIP